MKTCLAEFVGGPACGQVRDVPLQWVPSLDFWITPEDMGLVWCGREYRYRTDAQLYFSPDQILAPIALLEFVLAEEE